VREGADAERRPQVRARWAAAVFAFIAFFFLTGAATIWRGSRGLGSRGQQPIAFNHKKHVQELDLACSSCHQFYEKETFSGLPGADTCSACHQEPQGKSKEEEKLVRLLQSGAPLQWTALFRQPAHVFYSHRRHVVAARIECAVCHGSIAATTAPPPVVKPLRMQDCLDCHRRSGITTDCTACHR
jgi:hypothetical protein